MSTDLPVLVIGAAGTDIKGRPLEPLRAGTSNPGIVRNSLGGVARNIATNLARLEVPTTLLTAVGQDGPGDYLIRQTAAAGVDMSHILRVPGVHTGSFVAILDPVGQLIYAVSEFDIVGSISPTYLRRQRELFAGAGMIAIDTNLTPKALKTVFSLAQQYNVPVCADPTSQLLAGRLVPHLPQLYMVAPDAHEAAALCETSEPATNHEEAVAAAQCLVNRGVKVAIVTLGEHGLAYADGSGSGHISALRTQIVDSTGVGDALTAAVIFGLINDMPVDEAIRLGISAAAITLRTPETVVPNLSVDMLYDELVV